MDDSEVLANISRCLLGKQHQDTFFVYDLADTKAD